MAAERLTFRIFGTSCVVALPAPARVPLDLVRDVAPAPVAPEPQPADEETERPAVAKSGVYRRATDE